MLSKVRVLILSNTRPSRSWRFAGRIAREIAGVEICGIVQRPLSQLSTEQAAIAEARPQIPEPVSGPLSRLRTLAHQVLDVFVHFVLWFVHGCPAALDVRPVFTGQSLAEKCAESGWPFLEIANLEDSGVSHFIDCVRPDLIVALGEAPSFPAAGLQPVSGWLRARSNEIVGGNSSGATGLHIRIEHLSTASGAAQDLTSLTLPRQLHDARLGFTLKSDLVTDDLLAESVAGLLAGGAAIATRRVTQWVQETLSPYLCQVGPSRGTPSTPLRRWYRSAWTLALETTVLCSPFIMGRNWLRRFRSRYPVLILVHHLVSDRSHRMSISTESFWRQVLFLRRHYRLVSLSNASELLESGGAPAPTVSLTFDDGYADNFVSLRAVANELDVPVCLFVTSQPVHLRQEFQHDVTKGVRGAFAMAWTQIRYWRDRGAEIGSHTRTHIRCRLGDRAALHREIAGSKADFIENLGEAPRFFAFPYGTRADMPNEAMSIAASAYPHFLSAYGGENFPEDSGNTHLFRKNAYPEPWELELELQSVFDFAERAKRRFPFCSAHFPKPDRRDEAVGLIGEPTQMAPRAMKNT